MRAAHTGATAIWMGGGLFYLLARAQLRQTATGAAWEAYSRMARMLVSRSFAVLVASGAYLVFDRLANPRLGAAYVAVLGLKLALVAAIVGLIGIRRTPGRRSPTQAGRLEPQRVALMLGAGAMVLGVILAFMYEAEVVTP